MKNVCEICGKKINVEKEGAKIVKTQIKKLVFRNFGDINYRKIWETNHSKKPSFHLTCFTMAIKQARNSRQMSEDSF